MSFEHRLKELGVVLPEVAAPVAAYIQAVQVDKLVYTSGQIPFVKGQLIYKGVVGKDLTLEEGYEAARVCVLNALAAVKSLAGSIDNIERIIRLTGYVNSVDGFTDQPKVMNGASEILLQIFGEEGRHARSAIGVNTLPLGAAVEVELIVKLK
ncbi:MAG: RidA family protein [Candidatus Sumerlaeota bacterium]|nr:RidA family protein [Candidatus Sumerlaeota bacterium]